MPAQYISKRRAPRAANGGVGIGVDTNNLLEYRLLVSGSDTTKTIVDTASTQTLTNKTLTAPAITSAVLTSPTITTGITPTTTDGAALGSTSKMFSDLFLALGGVINFNNGNMTLTHSAGVLAFAGGQVTVTQSSSVATATTIRTLDVATTLTGASAVNSCEAFRSTLTANVQTGTFVNAGMFKLDFSTSGYCTGLAGVVCAELNLPGSTVPGGAGTYAAFEAEINCPTSYVSGAPITPLIVNLWGAAKAQFDAAGYLFILDGMTSGSTSFWYDHQGTAPANVEEWIRIKTPAGVRYLAVYNAVV